MRRALVVSKTYQTSCDGTIAGRIARMGEKDGEPDFQCPASGSLYIVLAYLWPSVMNSTKYRQDIAA